MEKSEQQEIGSTHKGKRVEIYMEIDENGAIRKESLPFVVGVLASVSGDKEKEEGFADREAKALDRFSFDQVMGEIAPELHYSVDCTLPADPKETHPKKQEKLPVNLNFTRMEDFEPEQVAKSIPELNSLLQERKELLVLLRRLHSNARLAARIEEALEDVDKRKELLVELGIS